MKLTFLLAVVIVGCAVATEWNYDSNSPHGPAHWEGVCNLPASNRQSPIDIPDDDISDGQFQPFSLSGYQNVDAVLLNNGHTVQLNVDPSANALLTGGGLADTYKLAQFHFHWGSNDDQGSEHKLDELQFPMEVHFVHYNTKYADLSVAADKPDGLAVLGRMFQIYNTNTKYKPIFDAIPSVTFAKSPSVSLPGLDITDFMGNVQDDYYRYQGSLTTPPCYESVTWTVFADPIPVSSAQMQLMRTLLESESGEPPVPLVDNFRPIQPLNGRPVYEVQSDDD